MNDLETKSQFLMYTTDDGKQRIEVRLDNDTVWLSQNSMVELFQTTKQNISAHILNIFEEGELERDRTVKNYLTVQTEGSREVKRNIEFYNLDVIISVGYRVRSHRGTQFRKWATERLREYIVKGFTLDDERLAEPGGIDYFDELLNRIRALRTSEKRFYQKVKEIYALSYDYDPKNELTQGFFKTVQNKMLFAVSGMTAAEIISMRADSSQPNMGLTTWKGDNRKKAIAKADVVISKNYLKQDELKKLELIVTQFLDYAELQTLNRREMYMKDWVSKVNSFLEFNEQAILQDAGKVSAEQAKELAENEYEKFVKREDQKELASIVELEDLTKKKDS